MPRTTLLSLEEFWYHCQLSWRQIRFALECWIGTDWGVARPLLLPLDSDGGPTSRQCCSPIRVQYQRGCFGKFCYLICQTGSSSLIWGASHRCLISLQRCTSSHVFVSYEYQSNWCERIFSSLSRYTIPSLASFMMLTAIEIKLHIAESDTEKEAPMMVLFHCAENSSHMIWFLPVNSWDWPSQNRETNGRNAVSSRDEF